MSTSKIITRYLSIEKLGKVMIAISLPYKSGTGLTFLAMF
jgi:hypothetical protein